MRAVIVYESMFGNTREIAQAIGEGLSECDDVSIFDVNFVLPDEVDLMVVGGPTHVHGMSRASTRAEAERWAIDPAKRLTLEPAAPGRGIRDWVQDPTTIVAPLFAAFATRADLPVILSGNAAAQIDRILDRRATRRVTPAENFLVTKDSHMIEGEIARAREWGRLVAKEATALITHAWGDNRNN